MSNVPSYPRIERMTMLHMDPRKNRQFYRRRFADLAIGMLAQFSACSEVLYCGAMIHLVIAKLDVEIELELDGHKPLTADIIRQIRQMCDKRGDTMVRMTIVHDPYVQATSWYGDLTVAFMEETTRSTIYRRNRFKSQPSLGRRTR